MQRVDVPSPGQSDMHEAQPLPEGVRPFGAPIIDSLVEVQGGKLPEGENLSNLHMEVKAGLAGVRGAIRNLPAEGAADLDEYLAKMPDGVKEVIDVPEGAGSLSGWLANEADDLQVTGVLTWHYDRLEAQQVSPTFRQEVLRAKRGFADGVYHGTEIGVFHPSAYSVGNDVVETKVYKGDQFEMALLNAYGYHILGTGFVVTPPVEHMGPDERKTVNHELGHKNLGRLPGVFNEPVNDLAAIGITNGGDFSIERLKDAGSYPWCKDFLYDLCTKGRKPIDIRLFTLAYSAQDQDSREAAWNEVVNAVDESWGFEGETGVVDKIVDASIGQWMQNMRQGMPPGDAWEATGRTMIHGLRTRYNGLIEEAQTLAA